MRPHGTRKAPHGWAKTVARWRRVWWSFAWAGAAVLVFAGSLAPQVSGEGDCEVPWHEGFQSFADGTGSRVTHFRRPVITCGGGVRIEADSAVVFQAAGLANLFGNVVFRQEGGRLTAFRAQYFSRERTLRAWGGAILSLEENGSVFRGDTMVLLRAGGEGRTSDRLTVTGRRPKALLFPTPRRTGPDTAGTAPSSPYDIEAQRLLLEGEPGARSFWAVGVVSVVRDSLQARGDSLEYREQEGRLALVGGAWMRSSGAEMSGDLLEVFAPEDDLRNVRARGDAILTTDDVRVLAPVLEVFFEGGEVERLVGARDPALDSLPSETLLLRPTHPEAQRLGMGRFPLRPVALAEKFGVQADSLEIRSPGGRLEEVWAVGDARGESSARDSLNTPETPPLLRRDWMEGDTLVAVFAPAGDSLPPPAADSLAGGEGEGGRKRSYVLEVLTARGRARSLYRLTPADSVSAAEGKLAAHYVVGEEITVFWREGEVERMEVKGRTRGIHLEPVGPGRRKGGGVEGTRVSGARDGGGEGGIEAPANGREGKRAPW